MAAEWGSAVTDDPSHPAHPAACREVAGAVAEAAYRSEAVVLLRERLQKSMYVALRSITVCLEEGSLYLRGTVPTYYTKQVMLSLAEDLSTAGVVRIVDETRVLKP